MFTILCNVCQYVLRTFCPFVVVWFSDNHFVGSRGRKLSSLAKKFVLMEMKKSLRYESVLYKKMLTRSIIIKFDIGTKFSSQITDHLLEKP